jgi:hypothetical protein
MCLSSADGVIVTKGGRFAGWGLMVLDGKPVWSSAPGDGLDKGVEKGSWRRIFPDWSWTVNLGWRFVLSARAEGARLRSIRGADRLKTE